MAEPFKGQVWAFNPPKDRLVRLADWTPLWVKVTYTKDDMVYGFESESEMTKYKESIR